MKMVVAVFPRERETEVRDLISRHGIHAYTEVGTVTGEGITGKKLGNVTWPEKSTLVFAVVGDEEKSKFISAIKECQERCYPTEGVWACVLNVEEMVS